MKNMNVDHKTMSFIVRLGFVSTSFLPSTGKVSIIPKVIL